MNKSESQFLPPQLPRKRKALSSHIDEQNEKEIDASDSRQTQFLSDDLEDLDPELLTAFEQAVKDTPSSVEVDLLFSPSATRVTAPIIEDHIDPFTVPMPPAVDLLKLALDAIQAARSPDDSKKQN